MSLITNRLIRFSEYEINCAQWQLYWRGEPVPLNRKSFDLLLYLVGNADRVVAKEELLKALWPGSFVEEANLTQHIFLLRKALSRHSSEEKIIVTVTGRGYRFAAAVEGQAAVESQVVVSAEPSVTRITMEEEVTADTEDGAAATGLISKTRGEEYSGESTPLLSRRQPTRQELLDGAARGGSFASRHMLAILLGAAAVLLTGVALRLYARPTLRVHGYARLTNDGLRKDPGFFTSVLTDGHRVFFTEFQMNRSLLARVGVDGGETLSAPAPSDNGQVADILPERNELLIGSAWATGEDTPMRIMDIGSGAFHTLSGIRGHDGSWSPDGKKLAFAQGSSLFVASLTGGGTSRIATLPGILFWPRWSPDGRLLRFSETKVRSAAVPGLRAAGPLSTSRCTQPAATFA
jgi:DNA-binding winged helix-turn-helix (wHTH) protein